MANDTAKIISLMFAIGRQIRGDGRKSRQFPSHSLLHFQTLRYVQQRGKPLMHDVARYLCVTPPAATVLIDGLVKERFIARLLDTKDRRTVRVALTERGKKFLAQSVRARMGKLKKVFSALTAKERGQLIAILERVSKKNR